DGRRILELRRLAREVLVAQPVVEYVAALVLATHPESEGTPPEAARYIRFGASPRGGQAILLAAKVRALMQGRCNVSFEDVRAMTLPALRHRIILNFEGEAEGKSTDDLLAGVLATVRP
ncbi:MAG: AAA family ATPase, partial [Planctomycetes bacterium]|nr:AAA family ATPase [Planctomycetota bacterium]